jgi:hypothetical protein
VTLQDYINQVRGLVHDAAAVDWTDAELTQYINNARTATALDMSCVRAFLPNLNFVQGTEVYSLTGVGGATVTNPGSGYSSAPTVTISGDGTGATAIAVLNGATVGSIQMTAWGTGYTTATVGFAGGGGVNAAATAIPVRGMNVVSVSVIWGNTRYTLNYREFILFQAYFRAWTIYFQRPAVWTLHQQMQEIFIQPVPDQLYVADLDVVRLPLPLVNTTDVDLEVIYPWADAVQYWAAMLALNKNQNFQQAAYYQGLYERRIPRVVAGTGGARIPNPYSRTLQRRVVSND